MANMGPCDMCEQAPGLLLVSNLTNGDTQLVCAGCAPAWARALADALESLAAQVAEGAPEGGETPEQATARLEATHGGSTEAPAGAAGASDEAWTDGYPQPPGRASEAAQEGADGQVGQPAETEAAADE